MLAAYGFLAVLRDDTPVALDVATSLPTARTEQRCRQLRGCRSAQLPVSAGQAAHDA
jgi:hypothetical protein